MILYIVNENKKTEPLFKKRWFYNQEINNRRVNVSN